MPLDATPDFRTFQHLGPVRSLLNGETLRYGISRRKLIGCFECVLLVISVECVAVLVEMCLLSGRRSHIPVIQCYTHSRRVPVRLDVHEAAGKIAPTPDGVLCGDACTWIHIRRGNTVTVSADSARSIPRADWSNSLVELSQTATKHSVGGRSELSMGVTNFRSRAAQSKS
jgi:hypothetical protein